MTEERTPKNAPGPFYVAKDECIACRAPEAEARGLMSFDDDRASCFFERQPTTREEEYRAVRAVWASCCGAVRYGGNDTRVNARLESLKQGRVATAVTFAAESGEAAADLLVRIAENMASAYVGSTVGPATSTPRGESCAATIKSAAPAKVVDAAHPSPRRCATTCGRPTSCSIPEPMAKRSSA